MKQFAILFTVLLCAGLFANERAIDIETFDSGEVELYSWPDEDIEPDAWELSEENTFDESAFALRIWGNTWKAMDIAPDTLAGDDVWSIACFVEDPGQIHGFALADSANTLYYALDGSEELDTDVWVTAGQGFYPDHEWIVYQLPVGQDFQARFDYLPVIETIVFINNNDYGAGETIFDLVQNVTDDQPTPPQVSISVDIGAVILRADGVRTVQAQFSCEVFDPDSDTLYYHWSFGDGETSDEEEPSHEYTVEDDHSYTAMLRVEDESGRWGYASCTVTVDEGVSSLPLTINFVGDIMLARNMQGFISSNGVEAVFDPVGYMLDDADLTVANLECPLTGHDTRHPTKTIWFKGQPDYVDGLVSAGIEMVSLANNHTMDYLGPGLQETRETLDAAGILHGGAGMNSYEANLPAWWNEKGLGVAFCFSSDRTGQYNNYQPYLNAGYGTPGFANLTPWYALQQIEAVRDAADAVVMNWHCGSEYSTAPGSNYDGPVPQEDPMGDEGYSPLLDVPHMWDIELRHFAIDNGADAVICHHPHIMQGFEAYEGKLIAHSLGNFVFDLSYTETMPTCILQGQLGEDGFERWTIRPVFIDHYIPRPATGEMGLHMLNHVAQLSREFDTTVRVFPDRMMADVLLDPDDADPSFYSFPLTADFEEMDDWRVTDPLKLRSFGSISSIDNTHSTEGYEVRLGREVLWWGNMENEGCSLWNMNSNYESFDHDVAWRGERSLIHREWTGDDGVTTDQEGRLRIYSDSLAMTLQGYIKTDSCQKATAGLRFYNNRTYGYPIEDYGIGVELNGTNDWGFYWNEFATPEGASYILPYVYSEFSDEEPGPAWYDDISVVQWNEWTPIAEMGDIDYPNEWSWVQVRTASPEAITAEIRCNEVAWSGIVVLPEDGETVPAPAMALHRNYPNPFNPETTIRYSLSANCDVKLSVYNIRGQLVDRLVNDHQTAGDHQIVWRAADHASGVYFYRLEAGGAALTRKMLLIK